MSDLIITCNSCKAEVVHHCNEKSLREAAINLFRWRPEMGFPEQMKRNNPDVDGSEDLPEVPFLSEAFLYAMFGKEEGRTLLYLIRDLFRSMGLDPRSFENEAHQQLLKEVEEAREAARKRQERQQKFRDSIKPTKVEDLPGGTTRSHYPTFYAFDHHVNQCDEGTCNHSKRRPPNMGKSLRLPSGLYILCENCKREHFATSDQIENFRQRERPYRNGYGVLSKTVAAALGEPH